MLDPDEFELREHQYQALEALGYLLSLPAAGPGAAPAAGGQAGTADKVTVATAAELAAPLLRVLRWDRPAPVPRI